MLCDDDRAIRSIHNGQYLDDRRLEIRTAPDRLYYITISKGAYHDLNFKTACPPDDLKAVLDGRVVKVLDARGFVLQFSLKGELLNLIYDGDVANDPKQTFNGEFLLSDFKALLEALPY